MIDGELFPTVFFMAVIGLIVFVALSQILLDKPEWILPSLLPATAALWARGAFVALIDLTAHHRPLAPVDGELERLDCEGFGRHLVWSFSRSRRSARAIAISRRSIVNRPTFVDECRRRTFHAGLSTPTLLGVVKCVPAWSILTEW
jgi:hypothetical protein